ncbi:hypothetical protein D1872_331150 [compost metagenome]
MISFSTSISFSLMLFGFPVMIRSISIMFDSTSRPTLSSMEFISLIASAASSASTVSFKAILA